MNVGEVILENGVAFVILEMDESLVVRTQQLESYIATVTTVDIDGECKTLEEIINERSEVYMNGVTVHEDK